VTLLDLPAAITSESPVVQPIGKAFDPGVDRTITFGHPETMAAGGAG